MTVLDVKVAYPVAVDALAGVSLVPLSVARKVTVLLLEVESLFLQELAVNKTLVNITIRTCLSKNILPVLTDVELENLLFAFMSIHVKS